MAPLPPSPFSSAGAGASAETLVVASVSQAPAAATSSHISDSGVTHVPPDEAAVPSAPKALLGTAADIPDDLKQRFLAAIEEDYRFSLDQEKFLFDIGCVPDDFDKYMALMEALTDNDEPPLFIQQQMRA